MSAPAHGLDGDPSSDSGADALSDIDTASLAAWTLRTESPDGRHELARRAGASSWSGLLETATASAVPTAAPAALAHAGFVALLIAEAPGEVRAALRVMDAAVERVDTEDLPADLAQAYCQALLLTGRGADLEAARSRFTLDPMVDWALRADAAHPGTPGGDPEAWLQVFQEPFRLHGLEPIQVRHPAAPVFADLWGTSDERVEDPEMVTVVMSAFKPDADIEMAAGSVLAQSWTNLELLVIDDASPPGHEDLLARLAASDERVRLLRSPDNRGTYQARNLALAHARGVYMTFHDADDWTHPRRLERQVAALRAEPNRLAVRSGSFRIDRELRATYLGYVPQRTSAVSLMFRVGDLREIAGQFDSVRKSADMELPARLRAVRRGSVLDFPAAEPLNVVQLRPNSLSRGDVRPGWTRWTRIHYRDSYTHWHARIREGRASARLSAGQPRPFPMPDPAWDPVPRAGTSEGAQDRAFDVVLLSDFRRGQAAQPDALALLATLRRAGARVAVAAAEAPRPATVARERGRRELPAFLEAEGVPFVHFEQPLETSLLLVANPGSLELAPGAPLRWDVGRVALLARAPRDGVRLPYHPGRVADVVRRLFEDPPVWVGDVGEGTAARGAIEAGYREFGLGSPELADGAELSSLLDQVPPAWVVPARGEHPRLVIGHHLTDAEGGWGGLSSDALRALAGSDVDVRFRSTPTRALRQLDSDRWPASWSVLGREVSPESFLLGLDVLLVLGDGPGVPRAAREGMAAGCVVVVEERWRDVLGDAVVHTTPQTAQQTLRALAGDPGARTRAITAGHDHLWRRARTTRRAVLALARTRTDAASDSN